jgi:transposase-like protein
MRRAPSVTLSRTERREIVARLASPQVTPRVALRLEIVLRAARGDSNEGIARALRANPGTVALWRRRFLMQRVPGVIRDAPRPGRPPEVPAATVETIVWRKLGGLSPGAPRWSAERVARSVGVSKTTVQRIWRAQDARLRRAAKPARPEPDTEFAQKVTDLVGLYLNLPERAMVFSVDERARSSALGPRERKAIAQLRRPGHAVAFRAFLQAIERETPHELGLHVLLDGRMAPLPPEVARWVADHPRFHLHFLPTEGTNPSLIDQWFREFTQRRLRAGAFPSVVRLHRSIRGHFAEPGSAGRPFVWSATLEEIRDRSGRVRGKAGT